MKDLINYIESRVQLTNVDVCQLEKCFVTADIPAQTKLLEAGKIERYIYFLSSGVVKGYQNIDGKIVVQHLVPEQDFFTSLDSFMNQTPSDLNMQALEDSTVLLINRHDKIKLYESFPAVEKLFRVMSQKALVSWQRRLVRNHCYTAKERYFHFIQTYPDIAIKLTDKQIAGYLGISHEFLSKIKNTSK